MSKPKKIVLVGNINSGVNVMDYKKHGRHVSFDKIARMVKNAGGRVYTTGNSHDYFSEAQTQIELICKYLPNVFIAFSGDGGAVLVYITLLIKLWPYDKQQFPLLALPNGGSFGILANRLDTGDPIEHVKNILKTEKLSDLTVKDIKLMRVEDDSGFTHVSFSVGTGFPVRLLKEAYKKKHLKNLKIGMMTARAVGSAIVDSDYHRRFDGQQKMIVKTVSHSDEEEECDSEWLGIIAQTISSIGLPKFIPRRQEIFRKAEIAENTFHAIGVNYSFRRMLWEMPQIYAGESGTYRNTETNKERRVLQLDKQLRSLTITSDDPFEYQSCGEILGPTRTLHIHSYKTVRFIAGGSSSIKNAKWYTSIRAYKKKGKLWLKEKL